MDQNQVDAIEATRFLKKLQASNVLGRLENLEAALNPPTAKEPAAPVEPVVEAPTAPEATGPGVDETPAQ